MSALECADLQDSARASLVPIKEQPAGPNILPPFSGKLSEDVGLKLSNENFKQLIENSFNTKETLFSQLLRKPAFPTHNLLAQCASKPSCYFPKGKVVTPLSQLTATPAFPTPHVLAQFAFKAYEDHKKRDTDDQDEEWLELPDGWMLLTTAYNSSKTNGYFGAAYWHPGHQQVVIAHRGTDPTNVEALWADIKGVLLNDCVQQMESASTFAYKVVEVLREVNRKKGVSFELFFTGHFLGGWLAQITTFTTKYLKVERNTFLKSDSIPQNYHPHTVVFDSPGCKDMLSQMTDGFDVRLDGRSIDLKQLDITSYLSAPNRINTCNSHLGTVYRIFTDFSDMESLSKHTALYNLITLSMDKIVEAFDPETGQVYKDEQGRLKVQVVVDWPICTGLKRDKEYEKFFEWAQHLNNYNPDIKNISFQQRCLIHYQTTLYDERVNSLSIFSQEEQEFLQRYRWLRQWPEFFQPQELFSVIEDSRAQEDAKKILQSFEIGSDKIRCTDAVALQTLIAYVKRLLQLFPQVQEDVKIAFSSHDIRNKVYEFETTHSLEKIKQSPLDFNPDALSLGDFIRSDQQQVLQLQIVDVDEWSGLIKVYQVLEKTGCLSEGQYTVLKLKRLLAMNHLIDLSTLMLSTETSHLILMACEDNQLLSDEAQGMIRNLFKTLKEKPNIKTILSARSEGTTLRSLQQIGMDIFGKAFVTRDEQLTWSDITSSFQEKLLKKSVKFQGANISLNRLMSAESPAAKFLPLGALLEERELKIADPLPIPNAYNEASYIARTLRCQRAIKQEIYSDKDVKEFHVYLTKTEQEFEQCCKMNHKSNVHWLEQDKSGKLLWQQSQGSLGKLREYIDTESSHTYTADDLDKLLEQKQHQRVMLISDTAGVGKSTVLTHRSKQIKQKFPATWLVRINLNDHTDALQTLKQKQIDKEEAIDFVSMKLLNLEPGLENELFKQSCEQEQNLRVIIMIDGFDEICPLYKETVIDLVRTLGQTALEQLWVTTRPHLRRELEDKLQQLSYTIEPFPEENQVEFLTKFWSLRDWFTEMDDKEKEESKKKLEIYAEELIKKLSLSISDEDKEFTSFPLQCRVLAEEFDEEVKEFCQLAESVPRLPFKLDLIRLYRRFIETKYDIYQKEKLQVQANIIIAREQRERDLKCMTADLQVLALKVLFTEEQVTLLKNYRRYTFSAAELARIGIAVINYEGKLHFIHGTLAEYYVADFFVNQLTKGTKPSPQIQDYLLKDIFVKADYRVIRLFIDGLLSMSEPSENVLKQYGNRLSDLWEDGVLILYQAVREGNNHIIGFLSDSLQVAEHTDTLIQLLLAQDNDTLNVWHVAAECGNLELLQVLWELAKEKLTREDLSNKLLLAKDVRGRTAWHVAAEWSNLEVLQKLWDCAKEVLTAEVISDELLLAIDDNGQTFLHVAAKRNNTREFEKVWEWATEKLSPEEIRNLLLAKDSHDLTVLHVAANKFSPELLEEMLNWATDNLTPEEIKTFASLRQ